MRYIFFKETSFTEKHPSAQNSGRLYEHKGRVATNESGPAEEFTSVEGGQFVKHKNHFTRRRKASFDDGRKYRHCWLFEYEVTFPCLSIHSIRPFSVYLYLHFLAPDANPRHLFFTLAQPRVILWHFFICSVLYCRKTRTPTTFSSVCLLPCSCLRIF